MKVFGISLFVFAGALLVFMSCKKENEGPLIFVTPTQTQFTRQPGQLMEFTIELRAKAGMQRLRITKNENQTVTQTILDSALTGSNTTFQLPFQVPQQGVTQIYFVFTLTDTEGRQVSTPRRLVVDGAALLQESTGYEIYSRYAGSGALRAFNIDTLGLFQIDAAVDSMKIDVMDFDPTSDDQLSNQWTSGHGLQFVRLDGGSFNYPDATFATAKSAYQNGVKNTIVNNVTPGAIVITKYREEPEQYAVFQIVEVFDQDGSANDRYRFNLKK